MHQVIIVNPNSYKTMTEFVNIIQKASNAFMNNDFLNAAYPFEKYDSYSCVGPEPHQRKVYTNKILDEF